MNVYTCIRVILFITTNNSNYKVLWQQRPINSYHKPEHKQRYAYKYVHSNGLADNQTLLCTRVTCGQTIPFHNNIHTLFKTNSVLQISATDNSHGYTAIMFSFLQLPSSSFNQRNPTHSISLCLYQPLRCYLHNTSGQFELVRINCTSYRVLNPGLRYS